MVAALFVDSESLKVSQLGLGMAEAVKRFDAEALESCPAGVPAYEAGNVYRWDHRHDGGRLRERLRPMPAAARAAMLARIGVSRRDAAQDPGNALLLPQEALAMTRELEDKMRPLTSREMMGVDRTIPGGAKAYRLQMGSLIGEARLYAGSSADIPRVGAARRWEDRPVAYVVSSFAGNVLDLLATDYAGVGELARKRRAAMRAIAEIRNRIAFQGDVDSGLYGVFNHPGIAKAVSAVSFSRATDPVTLLNELNRLASWAEINSGATFAPNRMRTSPQVRAVLMQTRIATGSDRTIGEQFLATQPSNGIKEIESASEFSAAGPGGTTDAIAFYNDDLDSLSLVEPMDYTELPVQFQAFDQVTYCYASTGGVKSQYAGNNLIAFVSV
jgi:hypothetical protein